MSLDTKEYRHQDADLSDQLSASSPSLGSGTIAAPPIPDATTSLWHDWTRGKSKSAKFVFGDSAKGGGVYRWGVAVAAAERFVDHQAKRSEGEATDLIDFAELNVSGDQNRLHDCIGPLSRITCDAKSTKADRALDWNEAAKQAIDQFNSSVIPDALMSATAIAWAAALPNLQKRLDETTLSDLAQCLVKLHEAVLTRPDVSSITHLMIGGELGLCLAWRLPGWQSPGLPTRSKMIKNSCDAISDWCEQETASVSTAIEGAVNARLTLASLIRCRRLMKVTGKRKFTLRHCSAAEALATWVATMVGRQGTSAFSTATPAMVRDDVAKHGLLNASKQFAPESLNPAIDAAMGISQSGGRLAWEISLPESMWCDDESKLAVMLPQWDGRRGRTHVDFRDEDVSVEIFAGRSRVIAGKIQNNLDVNGQSQSPRGAWEEICRYTDDDVHYLELEQPWTSGMVIQRQFFLMREDRCLMIADAVLPQPSDPKVQPTDQVATPRDPGCEIRYCSTLPLGDDIAITGDDETTDLFLCTTKSGKPSNSEPSSSEPSSSEPSGPKSSVRRALVMPLSGSEWKVGRSAAKLIATDGECLTLKAEGQGRIYAPLWIDFSRRRFKRKRTWRQLTVVDSLNLVAPNEAAAFRVQIGPEQWVVYRSLNEPRCRTFLGKHLMADFFVSRFDIGDGTHDALITVDDRDDH